MIVGGTVDVVRLEVNLNSEKSRALLVLMFSKDGKDDRKNGEPYVGFPKLEAGQVR